ncbi:glutathione S-transferase [Pestalotiopsis sp. NC0098]|nr:glutathione S-transferase [Pestalotiopsis sp. NC0098]
MAETPPEKAPKPGLNIYGMGAVNPYKLTIAAEELGVPYNYISLDFATNEIKSDWYTAINPNGRVPAIVHVKDDGTAVTVFESAACLLYMVSEFDKENKLSYPVGTQDYWTQLSWLSWQVSGHGPSLGQSTFFHRYVPQPEPYSSWRFLAESRRLNHVLDKQLSTNAFVAGDRLTIADCAVFMYVHSSKWCGVDITESPHIQAWHAKVAQRPAFQKGLQVPVPYPFSDEMVSDPGTLETFQAQRKFGSQGIHAASEQWAGEPVSLPSDRANYS